MMTERKGTQIITAAWLSHIAANADDDGIWLSNPETRASLPYVDGWGDRYIHRRLQRLVSKGLLKRVSKGSYSVL